MTIAIMVKVWKDAPVAGTELLMLLALADIAGDEFECYPSIKHLAHKCRCSEKQAKRLLKSLERQCVIEIMLQAAEGRGKVRPGKVPNVYRITPDNWTANDYTTGDAQDPPHTSTGDIRDPRTPDAQDPPTGDAQDPLIPYGEPLKETLFKSVETEPQIEIVKSIPPKKWRNEDCVIDVWAGIRKLDAIAMGADYHTDSDRKKAKKMLAWTKPITPDEIRDAMKASKYKGEYPFAFLEKDILEMRAKKAISAPSAEPIPQSTPEELAGAFKTYAESNASIMGKGIAS